MASLYIVDSKIILEVNSSLFYFDDERKLLIPQTF